MISAFTRPWPLLELLSAVGLAFGGLQSLPAFSSGDFPTVFVSTKILSYKNVLNEKSND